MESRRLSRRTISRIYFGGIELTDAISKDITSLSITDEMEGAADDLQITLSDDSGIWSNAWIGKYSANGATVNSSVANSANAAYSYNYTVTATALNVRSAPSISAKILGTLKTGEKVYIEEITNGWGRHTYNGQTGYSSMKYLKAAEEKATVYSGEYAVGDRVTVNGRPQISSYGGSPGAALVDYSGVISKITTKEGIPYPIHIEGKGWVSEEQIKTTEIQSTENISTAMPVEFGKGTKIDVVIEQRNYDGEGKSIAQGFDGFELDSITYSGPPRQMTIKATSLPNTATVRTQAKTRAWENMRLSEITDSIAKEDGMKSFYDSSQNPLITRIEQSEESDISFLQRLAARYGMALKATSNTLVLFDEAEYEAKEAVRKIRITDLESWSFATGFDDTAYTSCHVAYTDENGNTYEYTYTPQVKTYTEKGKQYTVTGTRCFMRSSPEVVSGNAIVQVPKGTTIVCEEVAGTWIKCTYNGKSGYVASSSLTSTVEEKSGSGQVLEINERVESVEEARTLAMKRLREKNKDEFKAEITLPGDVSMAAGNAIELVGDGFGGWAGKYMIERILRSISSSGFTDKLELYRPLEE